VDVLAWAEQEREGYARIQHGIEAAFRVAGPRGGSQTLCADVNASANLYVATSPDSLDPSRINTPGETNGCALYVCISLLDESGLEIDDSEIPFCRAPDDLCGTGIVACNDPARSGPLYLRAPGFQMPGVSVKTPVRAASVNERSFPCR